MPLPVVELITQDVVDTLLGVTTGAGYNSNLIVERFTRAGNVTRDQLVIVHQDSPTRLSGAPGGWIRWSQPYVIECRVIESESSTTPLDQRINVIRCDVEKALRISEASITRGGRANDTIIGDPDLFTEADGAFVGIWVTVTVEYDTLENDPYSGRGTAAP